MAQKWLLATAFDAANGWQITEKTRTQTGAVLMNTQPRALRGDLG
jgi:hypothetical protein